MKQVLIEKDAYYDSVFLMLINREVKKIDGVIEAVVSMGTEMNVILLRDMGLADKELDGVTANDLIVAVEGKTAEIVEAAILTAKEMMDKKSGADEG